MYIVNCSSASKLPSIELLIENHWVEMRPEDYLVKSLNEPKSCMIGLIPSITDFFVFGDTLMRGFYTIHDDGNSLVGLVPHKRSGKNSP